MSSALRLFPIALVSVGLGAAGPVLTEAEVRRFLTGQESAWNARRLEAYFAGFTPDAVFVDQHRTPKEVIRYGRSTLPQARAAARRFLANGQSSERGTIRSVVVAPDGNSARVLGYEVTTVTTAGRTRRVCAHTDQTLVLVGGRIRSTGQTDSIVDCGR